MSTFKRYVVIQLMTFVFGIIGPIFLVIFFAAQPEPSLKWMYWFGLFITAADVLIALAITSSVTAAESKTRSVSTPPRTDFPRPVSPCTRRHRRHLRRIGTG